MNPTYFLNLLYGLLTAQGAFGYDVAVFKGLRSNLSNGHTLQIYPTALRESTRAENLISCTDVWQITGAVSTAEETLVQDLLAFAQDTRAALDKLREADGDFTYALLPEMTFNYENYPYALFHLQLEINYLRRINHGI